MPVDPVLRETIQSAYSSYLKGRALNARTGQKQMIGSIANYLSDIESDGDGRRVSEPKVCVIEAGTGTGKTLAYLAAMIPFSQALNKKLVIGTATVTLQQQVLSTELPLFSAHSGLKLTAALAKGRGRYLCLHKLDLHLQESSQGGDLFGMSPDGGREGQFESVAYEELLDKMSSRGWDGDIDHLDEPVDEGLWRTVTVDHRQCLNRSCQYFSQCPFFRSKAEQEDAEVIVANHDLILADLALGGGIVLPAPEDCLYLFDEAHHLPDKTLSHFSANSSLQAVRTTLNSLSRLSVELQSLSQFDPDIVSLAQDLSPHLQLYHQRINSLQEWLGAHVSWSRNSDSGTLHCRFEGGQLPEEMQQWLTESLPVSRRVLDQFDRLLERVKELSDDKDLQLGEDARWPRNQVALASLARPLEGQHRLWEILAESSEQGQLPVARWLTTTQESDDQEVRLFASPTDASGYLLDSLWNRCFGAVLTSATLSLQGDFQYFFNRCGLPPVSQAFAYPSPFNYPRQAALRLLDIGHEPGDREEYFDALAKTLCREVQPDKASLVLFNARKHLMAVADRLQGGDRPEGFWKIQDGGNRSQILRAHREQVKEGKGSCLMGLASFAEGLDLPGSELEHVLITRLPFSVPDDPIDATLSEWLESQGRSPFFEISLPAATIRLIQACGRLLRSETDEGTITILDRRLWTRRYGQRMLGALPPFRIERIQQ